MSRRHGGWAPYVPVAQRRAKAHREMSKLEKKGTKIQPVEIEGRTIARSFWGKGWCDHLEGFGDLSNRLPRGRTYVRNGSVCHLAIEKGSVRAIVSGSGLYEVTVAIEPLPKARWNQVKKACQGKIGSLIELLQGRLSEEVMALVTGAENGLFPRRGEISYDCSCPDWAGMCKHIAAVMYGIGARLDDEPELLFRLRGVNHEDLIAAGADPAAAAIGGSGSKRTRRRVLSGDDLESVFDVELESTRIEPSMPEKRVSRKKPAARRKRARPEGKPPAARKPKSPAPFKPASRSVIRLRKRHGMTQAEFARAVGVSPATVKNWESAGGPISPHAKGLAGLTRLHEQET